MAGNTARKRTTKSTTKANLSGVIAPETETATNLNRLVHERTRLAIISALAVNDKLTFTELKKLLRDYLKHMERIIGAVRGT